MKFVFHPEAEAEFFAVIEYYESAEAGLGRDFSLEVLKTIQHGVDFPLAWPVLIEDIHRCLTNRFPFGVCYRQEGFRCATSNHETRHDSPPPQPSPACGRGGLRLATRVSR